MKNLPYHFTYQFFWSLVPFCLVLASLSDAWLVFAEEKPQASGVTLLLMKSGRMLSGHISEGAGGYLVKNPSGSLLVPYEDIVFEAKNLHEIYLKQRKSMKFPTANTHLNLARWCITNKLYEEAKIELKDAIRLEPKRSEPQLMLQRLMRDSSTNRLTVNQKIQEKILKKQAERSEEATSLTGISREQSAIFVRKIQPILSNKCGNANCHGSATKSQFRLTQISRRYGNHRIHAERNLAEVLRWIDLDDPTRSQLLVKPEKEHPQRGMVVFSGHAARKQKQLLQKWVSEVVADRIQQDELRAERLARRAARRHGQAKKNLLDPNWGKSAVKQAKLEAAPAALKGDISLISGFEPKKLTDAEIEEMVQPKPEDPFDPELFNNPKPADQP
ncbi:hypothetical protein [Gimesia aquarii]|uniref:Uncharacterized protein n=1 Tax=Gimesia aquarii TaxID=2527964 RepID=A0A517VXX1_9PLAN|nr:hypothetical protein [Gimesia aquarii]QDT97848.1 hypothetical protein V144x_33310 [Gimesia aquarii]